MHTRDYACASTGRTLLSLTSILVVREQTLFVYIAEFVWRIRRRWLKVRSSPKDRKLLQDVAILHLNETPTIIVGRAEKRRRGMMFVLPRKRKTAIFVSNFLQNKGRN